VYYIDKNPSLNHELSIRKNLHIIAQPATIGVRRIVNQLMNEKSA
jgi:hypothetical protein